MFKRLRRRANLAAVMALHRTSLGSWLLIDGIAVVGIGTAVDQHRIIKIIRFVTTKLIEKIGDEQRARQIVQRTIVILKPGAAFTDDGAELAAKVVRLQRVHVGVITVAYGAESWERAMAKSLARLWSERIS